MALRDDIRRLVGSRASSKVAKSKNVLKGDVEFDVQQKGDAHYLIVNVGKLKYRIPMAGDKKPPHKFFKDYVGLEPHYDSGWVDVTDGTDGGYDFVHNLGTKMLLQQWYFKTDAGAIFDFSSTNHHEMYTDSSNKDTGVTVYMQTANMINVATSDYRIFITSDNIDGGDGSSFTTYTDGYLRCFLWKIGKTE